jgi:hypothetical protein
LFQPRNKCQSAIFQVFASKVREGYNVFFAECQPLKGTRSYTVSIEYRTRPSNVATMRVREHHIIGPRGGRRKPVISFLGGLL